MLVLYLLSYFVSNFKFDLSALICFGHTPNAFIFVYRLNYANIYYSHQLYLLWIIHESYIINTSRADALTIISKIKPNYVIHNTLLSSHTSKHRVTTLSVDKSTI